MRVALFLCVLGFLGPLAACTAPERGVRDTSVRMNAVVDVAPARLAGTWQEVAGIGRGAGGAWTIAAAPGGALRVSGPDGTGEGHLSPGGKLTLSQFRAPLYLLWIDADDRTLVLGTPSGAPAIVLDRRPALPADRAAAVREILAWNGYDLTRLK